MIHCNKFGWDKKARNVWKAHVANGELFLRREKLEHLKVSKGKIQRLVLQERERESIIPGSEEVNRVQVCLSPCGLL